MYVSRLAVRTALQELDLDGDWDPEAHDRQMRELYEREADADAVADDEKPTWDDDIDITDIVPPSENEDDNPAEASSSKKKKKKKKQKGSEDDADMGGVDIDEMDAEVERPPAEEEEWDGSEEMRKRALEKYMDELYELEFNDMVGSPSGSLAFLRLPQNSRIGTCRSATSLRVSNTRVSLLRTSDFPPPKSSWRRTQSSTSSWASRSMHPIGRRARAKIGINSAPRG